MGLFLKKRAVTGLIFCLFFIPSQTYAGKTSDHLYEDFFLYIPSAALKGQTVPVIIALSGSGVSPKEDILHWRPMAEQKGFFVLDFDIHYDSLKEEADIVKLHERIQYFIGDLSERYHFDRREIFLAGSSAGAVTAFALSLRYPAEYRDAALVSGATIHFQSEDYLKNAKRVRYLIIHGNRDESIPLERVYMAKNALEKNGSQVTMKLVPGGKHALPASAYRDAVNWFYSIYVAPQRKYARMMRGAG